MVSAERRGGPEDFCDACGHFALPVRTGDEKVAGVEARRAAADVAVVVRIAVDQLHRVVASLGHRRHRNHHRLRAQVEPEHRIGRVAVGRDDGRVLVGEDPGFVVYRVERRLVLSRVLVDDELVHHRVVHDQRQAVDECLLGDGFGFGDARRRNTFGHVFLFGLCYGIVLFAAGRDQHGADNANKRNAQVPGNKGIHGRDAPGIL